MAQPSSINFLTTDPLRDIVMAQSSSIKLAPKENVATCKRGPLGLAAWRVFNTFELLESILLELDMQTLLLNQRVNRAWHDTIQNSILLQKKLWFIPGEDVFQAQQQDNANFKLNGNVNQFLWNKINAKCQLCANSRKTVWEKMKHAKGPVHAMPRRAVPGIARVEHKSYPSSKKEICILFDKSMYKPGKGPVPSWRKMYLLRSYDPRVRWIAQIEGVGRDYRVYNSSRYYCPEQLKEVPTMEVLLKHANEHSKACLRERPLKDKIFKDRFGKQRWFCTLLQCLEALGIAVVLIILAPIWFPILIGFESIDRLLTKRRNKR